MTRTLAALLRLYRTAEERGDALSTILLWARMRPLITADRNAFMHAFEHVYGLSWMTMHERLAALER